MLAGWQVYFGLIKLKHIKIYSFTGWNRKQFFVTAPTLPFVYYIHIPSYVDRWMMEAWYHGGAIYQWSAVKIIRHFFLGSQMRCICVCVRVWLPVRRAIKLFLNSCRRHFRLTSTSSLWKQWQRIFIHFNNIFVQMNVHCILCKYCCVYVCVVHVFRGNVDVALPSAL